MKDFEHSLRQLDVREVFFNAFTICCTANRDDNDFDEDELLKRREGRRSENDVEVDLVLLEILLFLLAVMLVLVMLIMM